MEKSDQDKAAKALEEAISDVAKKLHHAQRMSKKWADIATALESVGGDIDECSDELSSALEEIEKIEKL